MKKTVPVVSMHPAIRASAYFGQAWRLGETVEKSSEIAAICGVSRLRDVNEIRNSAAPPPL
jgi:hypothetical protein